MPPCVLVDVELGEAKIDHVEGLVMRLRTQYTISKLDVSMKEASCVHEAEPIDLFVALEAQMYVNIPVLKDDRKGGGLTVSNSLS